MKPVNNFFTDLLDLMIANGAASLVISENRRPSMMYATTVIPVHNSEVIDGDEMLYDLEALGIEGVRTVTDIVTIPFTYVRDGGQDPVEFSIEFGRPYDRLIMEVTHRKVTS